MKLVLTCPQHFQFFSSGVYFNDSTKAVLSAVGDNFVYVERRKPNSERITEPISAYTLANYPEDALKKKVTLLQHFRSYLSEQQKQAEEKGEAEPLTSNFEERQDTNSEVAMVYMKKWIRTKHAMLFRLSNGTVQVRIQTELTSQILTNANYDLFLLLLRFYFMTSPRY